MGEPVDTITSPWREGSVSPPARTRDELLAALDNDEWLQIGEAAVVIGMSRSTVHRMVRNGKIRVRRRPSSGVAGQRELNPEDVRREMERKPTPEDEQAGRDREA
jgi:excisionase family DNA binding protein